jgi:hypothetical protein
MAVTPHANRVAGGSGFVAGVVMAHAGGADGPFACEAGSYINANA